MATYGREKTSINRQKMRILLGQFSKINSPQKSEIAFLNAHAFKSQPTNKKIKKSEIAFKIFLYRFYLIKNKKLLQKFSKMIKNCKNQKRCYKKLKVVVKDILQCQLTLNTIHKKMHKTEKSKNKKVKFFVRKQG